MRRRRQDGRSSAGKVLLRMHPTACKLRPPGSGPQCHCSSSPRSYPRKKKRATSRHRPPTVM